MPPKTETDGVSPDSANILFRVNLNTADVERLQCLPGIGPVLAQRIVDYRDSIGHYEKPEDLLGVAGIGEKKLLKMEPFLTF